MCVIKLLHNSQRYYFYRKGGEIRESLFKNVNIPLKLVGCNAQLTTGYIILISSIYSNSHGTLHSNKYHIIQGWRIYIIYTFVRPYRHRSTVLLLLPQAKQ